MSLDCNDELSFVEACARGAGKRNIALALMEQVLREPEQKVPEADNITCFQSKVTVDARPYLLRVMVNETVSPPVVVTVYRTKKITKYWRKP